MEMDVTPTTETSESATNVAPMDVHGWRFEFVNSELQIVSEDDPNTQINLNAQAAFSLLNYLYEYREKIREAAQTPEGKSIEEKEVSKEKPGLLQPTGEKDTTQGKVELL
ncbi:MAG TPA: hypothetical protein VJ761_25825 [Ktedonobacteraceae bacterium]|nr:hypothetical protein [Ktedonobacteraceae bacterium]